MFQCKDLFTLPSLSSIKLICGESGLSNVIRWSYKAETQDLSKWVKGHELLIISGAVIERSDFNLSSLISQGIELKLSGALLLVGENYIKSIPKNLLNLCNTSKFPMFIIHWSTPLVDIFEELGHAIVTSNNTKQKNEDFLASIVFGNELTEEFLLLKSPEIDYSLIGPQRIFSIHFHQINSIEDKFILDEFKIFEFKTLISTLFETNNIKLILSTYGNNIIGLFSSENNLHLIESIFKTFKESINSTNSKLYSTIGIGKCYSSISKIQKSFQEASKCISIAAKFNKNNTILSYEKLGILTLFYEIQRNDMLENFYKQILGELIKYDKKNNTVLLETLKIYFNNDCSIINTAKDMDTHRNTVKYRMKKIQSITNHQLDDPYSKLNLQNAILIYTLLH